MKTLYELRFEKLMISMILQHEPSHEQQLSSLYDFHQNSRKYYDALCDALYEVSVGRSDCSLLLTSSGEPKLIHNCNAGDKSTFFKVTNIPSFKDDLIDQIEFVLSQIESFLKEFSSIKTP